MHEATVVAYAAEQILSAAEKNDVKHIRKVVFQIGEASVIIPYFVRKVYPAVTDGTILEGSELEIEVLPATALCLNCQKVYRLKGDETVCPFCGSEKRERLSGFEFIIKEIVCS